VRYWVILTDGFAVQSGLSQMGLDAGPPVFPRPQRLPEDLMRMSPGAAGESLIVSFPVQSTSTKGSPSAQ
jgi:hypothetical protein